MILNYDDLDDEQKQIVNYNNHIVVRAPPGSGKTTILAIKIKKILEQLPKYQGIISISFTNKASDHLQNECKIRNVDTKKSYFGTIDKFLLQEIVFKFASRILNKSINDVIIYKKGFLLENYTDNDFLVKNIKNYEDFQHNFPQFISIINDGILILDYVAFFALYIIKNSSICKKYLNSRYSHIIIDEYQDSSQEQHQILMEFINFGLIALIVGDENQSIFKYAHKDPKFLIELSKDSRFHPFPLKTNHRSHPSIINYSNILMNGEGCTKINTDNINVFEKEVNGDDYDIIKWIDKVIPIIIEKYSDLSLSNICILVRNHFRGAILSKNLKTNNKLCSQTELDKDESPCAILFSELLDYKYDYSISIKKIFETKNRGFEKIQKNSTFIELLKKIRRTESTEELLSLFRRIALEIYPEGFDSALAKLIEILSNSYLLEHYKPLKTNQVQIHSLHSSKGLEFEIVFHLDLYEWIIPKRKFDPNNVIYTDFDQDLNLHNMGLTRAKKCCFLLHSTRRYRKDNTIANGKPSELLYRNNLFNYRIKI